MFSFGSESLTLLLGSSVFCFYFMQAAAGRLLGSAFQLGKPSSGRFGVLL